ncbi:MAG TPA: tripartite tricarboxylate transporter substrate-binding protein [Xanthobacteraceae bacterium]|jgi:tripartite-type tricarboxylate transporter receptor subunit TctC
MITKTIRLVCVLAALISLPCVAPAQTVEGFYRGKQLTLLIGSGVAGGYDTYARVFARHFANHLPGEPSVVPKNVPAAGGLTAANTLYNVSARDGLTIAALTNGVAMDPLFGNPAARFDAEKFNWIGSIGKLQNICATWFRSPIKTVAAMREREVVVAAAGATSNTAIVPHVLNALLGTRFRVIAGYDPGAGLNLALEGREVEGICGLSWSTLKASRPDWIREQKLNVILQMGFDKLPDLANVPSARDLVSDPASRQVLDLILIRQEMGRPYVAPPGVPADRVAALRAAFDATMRDPEFLAEAQRFQMEIDPLTGDQIGALLARAYGSPPDIVRRAAELVAPATLKAP